MADQSALARLILLVVILAPSISCYEFIGCLKDANQTGEVWVSPGVYSPESVQASHEVCIRECGLLTMNYAGIWKLQMCFCANNVSSFEKVSDATCDGDELMKVFIAASYDYSALVEITLPDINGAVGKVNPLIKFDLFTNISNYLGETLNTIWYGESSSRDQVVQTTDLEQAFLKPDVYHVKGKILSKENLFQLSSSALEIVISQSVTSENLNLNCDLRALQMDIAKCDLTIGSGAFLKGKLILGDETTESILAPEIPWERAGLPVINYPITDMTTYTETGLFLLDAEFKNEGILSHVELYAANAGDIALLLFRVDQCTSSENYCFISDSCESSSSTCTLDCSSDTQFCPVTRNCINSCSGRMRKVDNSSEIKHSLRVEYLLNYKARAGYQTVSLSPSWLIKSGDRLGFYSDTPVIAARPRSLNEGSDFFSQMNSAPIKSTTIATSSIKTKLDFRLFISGAARPTMKFKFERKFQSEGSKTVAVHLTNSALKDDPMAIAEAIISIEPYINDTRIKGPKFGATNDTLTFTLLAHSGVGVNYHWNFGDGSILNTTETTVTHNFDNKGDFTINVTSFNPLDSKENITTITIQDRVIISDLDTPTSHSNKMVVLTLSLSSGSSYFCNWTIEGELVHTSPEGQFQYNHTYMSQGNYSVRVICWNDVSIVNFTSYQNVIEEIKGLKFINKGGIVNEPSVIRFNWDSGSQITFFFSLDNTNYSTTHDVSLKQGETDPITISDVSSAAGTLHAFNELSTVILVCNFTFDERITQPKLLISPNPSENGSTTTIKVTMSTGTSINLVLDYGDGSANHTHQTDLLAPLVSNEYSVQHIYSKSGVYMVTANISNPGSRADLEEKANVMGALGEYQLVNSLYQEPGKQVEVKLQRISGGDPVLATVEIDWGDSSPLTREDLEDENIIFRHAYSSKGYYVITATVNNPLKSPRVAIGNVTILNAIGDVNWSLDPRNVKPGGQISFRISISLGDQVDIVLDSGVQMENQTHSIDTISPTTPATHTFQATYSTVGSYNYTANVCNPLGCKNSTDIIHVQHPVTEDVKLIHDGFSIYPNPVKFTLSWVGDSSLLPTDATYVFLFNDANFTGDFSSGNLPVDKSHSLSPPGFQSVPAIVSNLVSQYRATAWSGSFVPFGDLNVTIVYGAEKLPGSGDQKNRFPLKQPVYFIFDSSSGTVAWAVVSYKNLFNNSVIDSCNMTVVDNTVNLTITEMGDYEVNFLLWNPISNKTFVQNISIGGSILNMRIDPGSLPLRPKEKRRIDLLWDLVSEEVCICVDFGNGWKAIYGPTTGCDTCINNGFNYTGIAPVNNKIGVEVMYEVANDYVITMFAYNEFTNSTYRLSIPVSLAECLPPILRMANDDEKIREYKRSQVTIIEGIVANITCPATLENEKVWTVHEIDVNTKETIRVIDVTQFPSHRNTRFAIEENFLAYGYYRLTFSVTMNTNITIQTFRAEVSTIIRIIPSEIRVILAEGSMQAVSKSLQSIICFNPGALSYDPDVKDRNSPQNITGWEWYCRGKLETSTETLIYPKGQNFKFPDIRTGCFGDGPGRVNTTDSELCFHGRNLEENKTYVLEVKARKNNRAAEARVEIKVRNGPEADLKVGCLRKIACSVKTDGRYKFLEQLINPSDNLILNSSCNGTGCAMGTKQWRIHKKDESADSWVEISKDDNADVFQGIHSSEISINAKFFLRFPEKRFRACFELKYDLELGNEAFSCLQFYVNSLPNKPNCDITPGVGELIIGGRTQVKVKCDKQSDVEHYHFYIKRESIKITLGFSSDGEFSSLIPSNDQIQTYCVTVYNKLGGFISNCFANITTKELNITELKKEFEEDISDTKKQLDEVIAKGNLRDMSESFLKVATFLKTYGKVELSSFKSSGRTSRSAIGYGDEEKYKNATTIDELSSQDKAQYEENRNKRAAVLDLLSNNIDQMMTNDLDSLDLVSTTCDAISENFDDLTRNSQTKVMERLDGMTNDLIKLQEQGSKDKILSVSFSLVSGIWNTMTSATIQERNGVISDFEIAIEKSYYDTDLESENEEFLDKDTKSSAFNGLYLETNELEQKSVASVNTGTYGVNSMNRCRQVMSNLIVKDDNPIAFQTPNGAYLMEKRSASAFKGKKLKPGRGEIELSDICANSDTADCGNAGTTLEVVANPNNVYSYLKNSNGKGAPLLKQAEVISVSFYQDKTNEKFQVKNLSKPIEMFLPKDPGFVPPEFEPAEPNNSLPQLPPPRVLPGTGDVFSGPQTIEQKLILHTFTLAGDDQSAHFQMRLVLNATNCTQFLVVARLYENPKLTDANEGFTFWSMIPRNTKYCYTKANSSEPDPFTFFIDNVKFANAKKLAKSIAPDYSTTKNSINFGVRELNPEEWNKYDENNKPPLPYPYSNQIQTPYYVRFFSSGCYHLEPGKSSSWYTNGCQVGSLSTDRITQCLCNHLTSFAGGWVVAPNTINFDYVFANFDFTKNPTLYATEITIAVVFLALFIWARYKDKKDIEKLGVTPMQDNDPTDLYLYEVMIDTGLRARAGTQSKVYFTLAGEMDETEARSLNDSKRQVLQRGNTDRFLMAVPRPLGNLQYVRIWHDNSGIGNNASWYCNYFGVLDLQTKEKYHFLVNQWFAVEEEDGMIDRVTPVAGIDEMLEFNEMFSRTMKKNLTEDHLWLSVVARPPESRFTRFERVGCCLFLLFLTMVTTCMFYQQEGPAKSGASSFTLGPFALTPREVYVGIVTNLITFFPLLITVELFRRSQLFHGHANKLRKAVENHLETPEATRSEREMSENMKFRLNGRDSNGRFLTTPRETTTPAAATNVAIEMSDTGSHLSPINSSRGFVKDKSPTPIKKKKLFPWWVRIFAWTLLILGTIVSCVFTTFYGIMFGDLACKKWITSMFISFFASVCLTQPVKVIFMAIFFSLLCKKADHLEDEEYMDEEDQLMNELGQKNGLFYDEEYLHDDTLNSYAKPYRPKYLPPNAEDLEKAREYRLNELRMFDVLREILFYLLFFCTLLIVTYSFRDPNSFYLKEEFERVFIRSSDPTIPFEKIRSEAQFWNWTKEVLVPSLRASNWYNGERPVFQRGFLSNRANRLIGYATMRQVRVKSNSCKVYSYISHITEECFASYNFFDEETNNYGKKWEALISNGSNYGEEFRYKTSKTLQGYPFIGRITTYTGGGYVHEFRGTEKHLRDNIDQLEQNRWLDPQTRAIFVEFTTYNPNINLFAICTLLFESPGTGGLWPSFRIEPANLLSFAVSEVKAFELICYAVFILFLIIMLFKECKNVYKQRLKYFTNMWNWCEIFIIGSSIGSIFVYVYIQVESSALTTKFERYHGNVYMKFQQVGFWNEQLTYATALIVFAATIKFIRLLRFNKRMGMLGAVLKYAGRDMQQFFILFLIMFLAFAIVFYSLYMDTLHRYHTFLHTVESSMQIALGKFEFLELYQKEPILGPIVFAAYVVFIIFVMLNMFISILNEAFAKVRADLDLQSNDYELVEFITRKIVLWSGISQTKLGTKIFKAPVTERVYRDADNQDSLNRISNFSDRVDQLISYINVVYLVGDKRKAPAKPPSSSRSTSRGFTENSTEEEFPIDNESMRGVRKTPVRNETATPRYSRNDRKSEDDRGMTPVQET